MTCHIGFLIRFTKPCFIGADASYTTEEAAFIQSAQFRCYIVENTGYKFFFFCIVYDDDFHSQAYNERMEIGMDFPFNSGEKVFKILLFLLLRIIFFRTYLEYTYDFGFIYIDM